MKTKLITALRTSAVAIERGTFTYKWTDPTRCNCGILACQLLHKAPSALALMVDDMPMGDDRVGTTWTHYASSVCPITGIPEHKIFKELFSHGLTQADFHHLEYLTDEKIRTRMVMPFETGRRTFWQWLFNQPAPVYTEKINHKNGCHVALYMRAWADLLTEQGRDDAPHTKTKTNLSECSAS